MLLWRDHHPGVRVAHSGLPVGHSGRWLHGAVFQQRLASRLWAYAQAHERGPEYEPLPRCHWAVTAFMVVSALAMPLVGRLVDRYSLRWIIATAALAAAVGVGLMVRLSPLAHLRALRPGVCSWPRRVSPQAPLG